MRKKFAIPVIAAVTAVGGAAAAFAATNTYSVNGSITPAVRTHASPRHAVPVQFGFNFTVTGNPPQVIRDYSINAYGVRAVNQQFFPKCTNFQNDTSDSKCKAGAVVGTGQVTNLVYQASNPSNQFQCHKSLRVYNAPNYRDPITKKRYKRGLVLYLYGPGSQCGSISQSFVIPAQFVPQRGGGTSLNFTVPDNIRHQLGVLNVAVTSTQSTIKRLTATVRSHRTVRRHGRRVRITVKRRVGYMEKVNCLSGRTPLTVFFTDENNNTQRAVYNGIRCS